MVASPVRQIFGILQQYPALQHSLLSKKSTCIASIALQNTLVSALLADVAIAFDGGDFVSALHIGTLSFHY